MRSSDNILSAFSDDSISHLRNNINACGIIFLHLSEQYKLLCGGREVLFTARGEDCGGRSACYRGEESAPCYAIFRGSRVTRGMLCGGGMDPAPLLELERVFNA